MQMVSMPIWVALVSLAVACSGANPCMVALRAACAQGSVGVCESCAGEHQHELMRANCSALDIQEYCAAHYDPQWPSGWLGAAKGIQRSGGRGSGNRVRSLKAAWHLDNTLQAFVPNTVWVGISTYQPAGACCPVFLKAQTDYQVRSTPSGWFTSIQQLQYSGQLNSHPQTMASNTDTMSAQFEYDAPKDMYSISYRESTLGNTDAREWGAPRFLNGSAQVFNTVWVVMETTDMSAPCSYFSKQGRIAFDIQVEFEDGGGVDTLQWEFLTNPDANCTNSASSTDGQVIIAWGENLGRR
jgi:hypothetical protein